MAATAELPHVLRLDPGDFLAGRRKTARYRPNATGANWYGAAMDGRPLFNFREAERMRRDPRVQFGLRILRAPLYQLKVPVVADDPRVGRFAQATFQAIWDHSLRRMAGSSFTYGVAVGETTHRVSRGRVIFDRWDDVHPRDARPLEVARGRYRGEWCGVRVTGGAGGWVDPATDPGGAEPGTFDLRIPHAFWFAGETEYGNYWGRPRLADTYEPWLEKRGRHGAVDCRRLWFKKGAFSGGSMRYPAGYTTYTGSDGQSVQVSNQDLAREILEKFESGGVLALPNVKDPKTGDYLWVFEPPKSGGEVGNLIEYPKQLDREILEGLGIPPEIVEAAETGSGWSGRKIPAITFFTSEDEFAALLVDCIDRQMVRPLVRLNFGRKAMYKFKPESLAKLVDEQPEKAGQLMNSPEGQPPHAAAGPPAVPPSPRPPSDTGGGVRMSHLSARRLLRGVRQYERAIRLSWAPAQTRNGQVKAVGYGPNQGTVLYGRDARRALAGRPRAVTEKGKRTIQERGPGGNGAARSRGGPGDSPSPPKAPAVPHEALDALAKELPAEDKVAWPKITRTFRAVYEAAWGKITELGAKLAYDVVPAVADTAEDYMTGKASIYGDIDTWKHATGISWGFTQTLVKHAIGAGFAVARKVKGEGAGKAAVRMALDDGSIDAAVQVVAAALEAMHQAAGVDIPVDSGAIRELLVKRLGDRGKGDDGGEGEGAGEGK